MFSVLITNDAPYLQSQNYRTTLTPDYFSRLNTFFLRTMKLFMALPRCNRCRKSKTRCLFCIRTRQSKICNECRVLHFVIFLINVLIFLLTSKEEATRERKHSPPCTTLAELDGNTQARFSRLIKRQRLYKPIRNFIFSSSILFIRDRFTILITKKHYTFQYQFTKNKNLLFCSTYTQ